MGAGGGGAAPSEGTAGPRAARSAAGATQPRAKRGEGDREGGTGTTAAGPGGSEREMKRLGRREREQSAPTRGGEPLPWGRVCAGPEPSPGDNKGEAEAHLIGVSRRPE